ncbi:unnamed protein product [Linum trigynum]|uniref:Uncharacterized protein n=1 Tax=Linum trigynum TaxID=586398 RepID=A0AAV2GFS7_9ROSI
MKCEHTTRELATSSNTTEENIETTRPETTLTLAAKEPETLYDSEEEAAARSSVAAASVGKTVEKKNKTRPRFEVLNLGQVEGETSDTSHAKKAQSKSAPPAGQVVNNDSHLKVPQEKEKVMDKGKQSGRLEKNIVPDTVPTRQTMQTMQDVRMEEPADLEQTLNRQTKPPDPTTLAAESRTPSEKINAVRDGQSRDGAGNISPLGDQ